MYLSIFQWAVMAPGAIRQVHYLLVGMQKRPGVITAFFVRGDTKHDQRHGPSQIH